MTRFSQLAIAELKETVRRADVMWQGMPGGASFMPVVHKGFIALTSGTITAASGATAGTGTIKLQQYNPDSGDFETITDNNGAEVTATVIHFVETSIATDTRLFVCETTDSKGQGIYVAVAQAC